MRVVVVPNKWLVALSVTLGTLMGTLDATMLNIALPHIRGNLGASLQEITWVVTSFTTANVCIMPLTGFLGRRFGQKRIYMASLCVFLISSLLCGVAQSLPELVIFRALQGAGAGALLPTEQAILQQTFPPSQQGIAMAIFSMTVMLGPTVGPTLGGLIVDHLSWQWIFFVNLPVGLLGLILVARFVQVPTEFQEEKDNIQRLPRVVDWTGILLLFVSLSGMQILLEEGNRWGWLEPSTLALILGVIFGLLSFVYREMTTPEPAVHLELFREPVFLFGTLVAGISYAMLAANLVFLPVFMQETLGFTATEAGITLLPRVAVSAVITPLLGRFYNVLPAHAVLAAGMLTFGISCLQLSGFSVQADSINVAAVVALQGVGFSGINVTLTTLTLSRIPKHQKVDASGLHALIRQTGGALGIAVFAALLGRYLVTSRFGLIPYVSVGRQEVLAHLWVREGELKARGVAPGAVHSMAVGLLEDVVNRQASVLAFNKVFLIVGLLFLAALPLTLLLRPRPTSSKT